MASTSMIIVMGLFMGFNLMVIKYKLENNRVQDAMLDLTLLIVLGWLLSDTITGLAMGTVASTVISMYLLISPPKLDFMEDE